MSIAGLADGEMLIGIDFRPANGVLYGVGRIGSDPVGQLYTIDVSSGAATPGMPVNSSCISPPSLVT